MRGSRISSRKFLKPEGAGDHKMADLLGKYVFGIGVTILFCFAAPQSEASLILNQSLLAEPFFAQPFAGLEVVESSGGVGKTALFFSDLPDNSLPGSQVVNLLGNFQAFDPSFNPTSFTLLGVEVLDNGSTFLPTLSLLNFEGESSLTFNDSVDSDSVTYLSSNPTYIFNFGSTPSLDYSYRLLTDLPVGSFLTYDDVESGVAPEPVSMVLYGSGLLGLWHFRRRRG